MPGSDNTVAIELISTHIRRQMNERARRFRKNIADRPLDEYLNLINGSHEDSTLVLLPQTPQLKVSVPVTQMFGSQTLTQGIYTILRDDKTSRQDFIFFVDRLATLLIEKAMDFLPHRPKVVVTPTDTQCCGKELDIQVSDEHFTNLPILIECLRTSVEFRSFVRKSPGTSTANDVHALP